MLWVLSCLVLLNQLNSTQTKPNQIRSTIEFRWKPCFLAGCLSMRPISRSSWLVGWIGCRLDWKLAGRDAGCRSENGYHLTKALCWSPLKLVLARVLCCHRPDEMIQVKKYGVESFIPLGNYSLAGQLIILHGAKPIHDITFSFYYYRRVKDKKG